MALAPLYFLTRIGFRRSGYELKKVSIADYGAKSSERTVSTNDIKQALASHRGALLIPEGVWLFDEPIVVSRRISLFGEGYASELRYIGPPTDYPITFERTVDTYSATWQRIEGFRMTTTEADCGGIRFKAPLRCSVRDVIVEGCQRTGTYGLQFGTPTVNTEALQCRVENFETQNCAGGLYVRGNRVDLGSIELNSGLDRGIFLEGCNTVAIRGWTVQGGNITSYPVQMLSCNGCRLESGYIEQLNSDAIAEIIRLQSCSQTYVGSITPISISTGVTQRIRVHQCIGTTIEGCRAFPTATANDRHIFGFQSVGIYVNNDAAAIAYGNAVDKQFVEFDACIETYRDGTAWDGDVA
jgi:hypothetical protein